jgi:hypothetical protein
MNKKLTREELEAEMQRGNLARAALMAGLIGLPD